MSHRRRMSRVLLALLGVTIVVGLFTYVLKVKLSKASATSGRVTTVVAVVPSLPPTPPTTASTSAPAAKPDASQVPPTTPAPTVTQAPATTDAATKPSVKLALVAIAAVAPPADKPSRNTAAAAPSSSQKVTVQPSVVPAGPAPSGNAATFLAQAKDKVQSGKLLEARDLVNSALASGRVFANDAGAARQLLSEINQTVVLSTRRFADDKWGGTYSVQPGDRLDRIGAKYGLTPGMLMKLNGIADARRLRAGATIKVLKGPFHAVVNKEAFRLDLYLGAPGGADSLYVTSYPVGLGKDDSTPEGKWVVEPEKKIRNPVYYGPRGEGVIEANDPRNPLGEYWIGLSGTEGEAVGKLSYGIHGTIDPASIGKQASMGCVRMRNEDVAVVFDALVEGKSTVLVVD